MRNCLYLVLLFSVSACDKEKPFVESETPVEKTIEYHVFASKDYAHSYYDNVRAELNLSVGKVDSHTGETTILWDTTFTSRSIRNFPEPAQRQIVEKSFSGYSSKETLNVSYSIRYNDQGHLSQRAVGEVINIDQSNKVVEVGL